MSVPAELVSPNQVIEEMSFSRTPPQHSKKNRTPSYVPAAPPPSSAPPPPPSASPKALLNRDETLDNKKRVSYGATTSSSNSSATDSLIQRGGVLRGDASVRPNTGRSNSALGEGTALHQVIWRARVVNLVACTLAILFEISGLLGKLVFHPAKAVLGIYLIFFASVLCCFELHTPVIDAFIKDNFGMLQHPISRAVFLLLLATLCVGGGGILEAAVGFILFVNALYILCVYIRYPEYRQMYYDYQQSNLVDSWRKRATRYAWTNPDAVASILNNRGGDEKQSLIG